MTSFYRRCLACGHVQPRSLRWWIPLAAIALAWLGGCWPIGAQQVQLVGPERTDTRQMRKELERLSKLLGFERWIIVLRLDTLTAPRVARLVPIPMYRAGIIIADSAFFGAQGKRWCASGIHELWHLRLLPLSAALHSRIHPLDSLGHQRARELEEELVSDLARLPIWGCS